MMSVKEQVLGNIFWRTFSSSLQQNFSPHTHCQNILLSTSCQIWEFLPSGWGCLLICVLKIYFAFLGIIVKVKLPAIFCLHNLEWYCLQISSDAKYFFLSWPRCGDQGLIVVIVYYFQIWNKKEHNIIISRVISSHMVPMYIETHCIYMIQHRFFSAILFSWVFDEDRLKIFKFRNFSFGFLKVLLNLSIFVTSHTRMYDLSIK